MSTSYKIFIVDDEQSICEGLLEILNMEIYKSFSFLNGKMALKQFSKEMPDLCIIDLKMPEMDGKELIKKIKGIQENTKILLLSGSLSEVSNSMISELGIDKVLEKPISRKELLVSVREILGINSLIQSAPIYGKDGPTSEVEGFESIDTDSGNDTHLNIKKNKSNGKEKILIVDDDETLRLNLGEALASRNYSTITARDGVEALKILRQEEFDIILMDIHMPEMDGIEAVKRIKSLSSKSFIIMMTGEADDDEIETAIEIGGYACLRKPFTIKKLIKSIEWYSKAGKEMKRQYETEEKFQELPEIKKMSINLKRRLRSKFSSNRITIITIALCFISIVFGAFLLFFIEDTGQSISNVANRSIKKYDSYFERIIGFLERDEKRELK